MTRDQMIKFLDENPECKVTHLLFSSNEYLYQKRNDRRIWDENDYLFEDWVSVGLGQHNGLRMRVGGNWETGWEAVV